MVRHSFFKTLAVTVSSFQNQSRNARPYAQPTNKSNNDVRQISTQIKEIESFRCISNLLRQNSKPFGLSLDMERLVEWNLLISTIKSATNLDMEGLTKTRGFLGKQRIYDWKETQSSNPPTAMLCINQRFLMERNAITLHILSTQFTPSYHYHHKPTEIFTQSQRSGDLLMNRYLRSINWSTKETQSHHSLSRSKLFIFQQKCLVLLNVRYQRGTLLWTSSPLSLTLLTTPISLLLTT